MGLVPAGTLIQGTLPSKQGHFGTGLLGLGSGPTALG